MTHSATQATASQTLSNSAFSSLVNTDLEAFDLEQLPSSSSTDNLTTYSKLPAANTDVDAYDHLIMQLSALFGDVEKRMLEIQDKYSLGGLVNHAKRLAAILKEKKQAKTQAQDIITHFPGQFSAIKQKMALETFELMLSEF